MKLLPRVLAPGLVLAAVLGIVPAAQAANVVSPSPCVRIVPGQATFPVQASGFPAGAFITFKTGENIVGSGTADPAGNFDNTANPCFPPSIPFKKNQATVQLTADDGAGTLAGPVPVAVSRITVDVPSRSKPRKRVNFRVFGFEANKKVYLHIRRKGETKGRFSLGRTDSPCGQVTKKMRFMPLSNYRTGAYRYFFSHSKKFDKSKVIFGGKVTIFRTFSSQPSSAAQATAAGAWG